MDKHFKKVILKISLNLLEAKIWKKTRLTQQASNATVRRAR